jgi:phthalate 4,5-dioxygenase reductase subunit
MNESASNEVSFRTLVVTKKDPVAEGIFRFELRDEAGRDLPPFTARIATTRSATTRPKPTAT